MGEMADYLLNGDDCESCGLPFDEAGEGFPRQCAACQADDAPPQRGTRPRVVPCPACTRKFHSDYALQQHRTAKAH
jgi:Fe-S oxidoreductase